MIKKSLNSAKVINIPGASLLLSFSFSLVELENIEPFAPDPEEEEEEEEDEAEASPPPAKSLTRSSAVEGDISIFDLDNAALISVASSLPSAFLSKSWNVSHNWRSWSQRKRLGVSAGTYRREGVIMRREGDVRRES
jgi:hypothetical protein